MKLSFESDWPCLLFATDPEGVVVQANFSPEGDWEWDDTQVLLSQLVSADDQGQLEKHLLASRDTVVQSRVRLRKLGSATEQWCWCDLRSRKSKAQPGRVLFAAFNIDGVVARESLEQREMGSERAIFRERGQELQRAETVRTQFLSNMSHELRTPLTAVLGLSEALDTGLYGAVSAEQREALQTINTCGKSLLNLINDILDVTKLEAGSISLKNESLFSTELLAAVLQLHRKTAHEAHVEMTVREDASVRFVGDRKRIMQVLSNLLSNAIKFGEQPGEVLLSCTLEDGRVAFQILDRGSGIPGECLEKIFDSFTQLDHGLDRMHGGAGLGLSLVKKLTALMNGWLTLSDREGGGTVARVAFPLLLAEEKVEESKVSSSLSGLVVLVEDHAPTAKMLVDAMSSWGLTCQSFSGRTDFMERGCPPETKAVIMDGKLRDGSGLECIRQLRAREGTSDLPIILLTASEGDDIRRAGLQAGASIYLEKPIQLSQLSGCLQALLS